MFTIVLIAFFHFFSRRTTKAPITSTFPGPLSPVLFVARSRRKNDQFRQGIFPGLIVSQPLHTKPASSSASLDACPCYHGHQLTFLILSIDKHNVLPPQARIPQDSAFRRKLCRLFAPDTCINLHSAIHASPGLSSDCSSLLCERHWFF